MRPTYAGRVLRTALTPKWLALLALVLAGCVAFGWLGAWQLGVARDKAGQEAVERARSAPVVPLEQVVDPGERLTREDEQRKVSATGSYDASTVLRVPGKSQGGRDGAWLVTALDLDSGGRVPVVRGFLPDGVPAPPVPTGTQQVTGVLEPSDPPSETSVGAGEVGSVSTADLVNRWPDTALVQGYVVADPAVGAGLQPAELVALDDAGLDWRNAAYAVEWWVFAGFALWVWWRSVRDEHRRNDPWAQPDEPDGEATGDTGPDDVRVTGPDRTEGEHEWTSGSPGR